MCQCEWELDIVASGSQKGYMIPPGLSFIAMSQKAWEAAEKSKLPKFYLNLNHTEKVFQVTVIHILQQLIWFLL